MQEDSGDFRHGDRRTHDQVLLGQLIEAVKGLRREGTANAARASATVDALAAAVRSLTTRVDEFEKLAQRGRGILIGMGLASMGIGAIAQKIVDMVWSG